MSTLFRKKSHLSGRESQSLRRCLNALDLTFLGIGAVIGAGIFVLTGIAAATRAGPAIVISFILSGLTCSFAAMSYAELASSVGGCGSAYSYAYVGLGEFPAWIIGWDLILEYALSVSAVAVGWSEYFDSILKSMGMQVSPLLQNGPLEGGIVNLPAMAIIFIISILLAIGVKSSARFNTFIVFIKLAVIILFVIVASMNMDPKNWHPFFPFGWTGVAGGAALIFFAYIGFDAVSTAAEEVINPQRTLPIGIIASLLVCTLIYIIVAGLLTGMVPYSTLNVSSPISDVLLRFGYRFVAGTVSVGAIAGLTTVILVMYYGLTRVFLAMSRDRLLPDFFASVHPRTQTPVRIILSSGLVMGCISGFIPIKDLAELVNIGTLTAFIVVCLGVMILRRTHPHMYRSFKTPISPLIPILGVAFCLYLTLSLPQETWVRFFVWLLLGCIIYFSYSRKRSKLHF
ncbi:MAG: amino acid permease [Coxiella sp. RIFCSPHIGHO2_12_FULL_42_15]|nr:MAG: amino acid permease [Coxiella sp. RIFCSPHIGHO2_12_FULL_42_15]